MPASSRRGWCLVVPVKRLAEAKSRLLADLPRGCAATTLREELALAFAADTVAAALACPSVAAVVVVTGDPRAATVLAGIGARVVADAPEAGLNPALLHGGACAVAGRPGYGVAALSADLPALRPHELGDALTEAARVDVALVADAEGRGTTVLTARTVDLFAPSFGPGSRARHERSGAVPLKLELPSVRRDVDTLAHLREALLLGTGPMTTGLARTLLARLLPAPGASDAPGSSGAPQPPAGNVPFVQATVADYDARTRAGTVLLDDGIELDFSVGCLDPRVRLLRLGQRVRVTLAEGPGGRRVTGLTLSTFGDPAGTPPTQAPKA
jgi:2-phospho-L-lactate guanylyltransferase